MTFEELIAIRARLFSAALGWVALVVLLVGCGGAVWIAWDAVDSGFPAYFTVQSVLALLSSTFAAAGILGGFAIAIRIGSEYAEAHLDRLAELAGAGEEER